MKCKCDKELILSNFDLHARICSDSLNNPYIKSIRKKINDLHISDYKNCSLLDAMYLSFSLMTAH